MFYLYGIKTYEVYAPGIDYDDPTDPVKRRVTVEHLVGIFTTKEKAKAWVDSCYNEYYCHKRMSPLKDYDSTEIREILIDPPLVP